MPEVQIVQAPVERVIYDKNGVALHGDLEDLKYRPEAQYFRKAVWWNRCYDAMLKEYVEWARTRRKLAEVFDAVESAVPKLR